MPINDLLQLLVERVGQRNTPAITPPPDATSQSWLDKLNRPPGIWNTRPNITDPYGSQTAQEQQQEILNWQRALGSMGLNETYPQTGDIKLPHDFTLKNSKLPKQIKIVE